MSPEARALCSRRCLAHLWGKARLLWRYVQYRVRGEA